MNKMQIMKKIKNKASHNANQLKKKKKKLKYKILSIV